jgi:Ni,Fe-hydrogenase III large subunit/NADH:ubiquinone oxidoreductase subunit C
MRTVHSYSEAKNNSAPLDLNEIPVSEYNEFYSQIAEHLKSETNHCLAYYVHGMPHRLRLFCCIADDLAGSIKVFCHEPDKEKPVLKSLTPVCPQLHIFEREIYENSGIEFEGHPWMKPVRYPHDRPDKFSNMDNYPFYEIEGEELHEVGVGPIHAGVIEPGHFRFICNGEKVLHLEIQLGYQHRGIENLFLEKKDPLQRCILSESIAGDTSAGHALAHSQLIESLAGIEVTDALQIERCIALEMERIAVHIGDTAALCGDVAYQLGQAVCEALRTTIINTTQYWCGNRFGKGLIRPGGTDYPMTDDIADEIFRVLNDSGRRFSEITDRIYSLQTVLGRFEDIGIVTRQQALSTGAVGMAARTCGIFRDTRETHPFQYYKRHEVNTVMQETGDVLARGVQRKQEVSESVNTIHELIGIWRNKEKNPHRPVYDYKLKPESYAISVSEGWRGEICHIAHTDRNGNISFYKVKDPSLHNWMSLALAVRNQEISDFPVCNKSFNLSYCGHDL